MSVTFSAAAWTEHPKFGRILYPLHRCEGDEYPCEGCAGQWINLSNTNARDLFVWLGVDGGEYLTGQTEARELAARCRRRLWDEERNHDEAIDGYVDKTEGRCTVISCGRRPDYLREKTADLLKVAETAGDGFVTWG